MIFDAFSKSVEIVGRGWKRRRDEPSTDCEDETAGGGEEETAGGGEEESAGGSDHIAWRTST